MDVEKEIKKLQDRLSSLESKKTKLFGNSYSDSGSSSSDFIIKTRGKVKVQIGNKCIDLIKDGKINVDSKFIYKEDKVGTKDGIYVVDDKVILQIGGTQIDLKGEVGTTYVSFMGEQETTSEQKQIALENIGFYQKDLYTEGLKNGIVYVESENQLYLIQDGTLSAYNIDIPNPYPKQFIISANSNDGALVIQGTGKGNSLSFDSMNIYSQPNQNYLNSQGIFHIQLNSQNKINVTDSYTEFTNTIVTSRIQSSTNSENALYKLYVSGGESNLEVDNLIVRNYSSTVIPIGVILMYSGLASEIPKGWHICNGGEGTPNLTGKFIKASTVAGEIGGSSEIQLAVENMPTHNHTITGTVTTSENGAHTHTINGQYGTVTGTETGSNLESSSDIINTSEAGAHTHTVDLNNIEISNSGESKPLAWEPSYYSLIYIMKIS